VAVVVARKIYASLEISVAGEFGDPNIIPLHFYSFFFAPPPPPPSADPAVILRHHLHPIPFPCHFPSPRSQTSVVMARNGNGTLTMRVGAREESSMSVRIDAVYCSVIVHPHWKCGCVVAF
jgi:hypothetical protein